MVFRLLLILPAALMLMSPVFAEDPAAAIHKINVPFTLTFEGNPGTGYIWRYDVEASTSPERAIVAVSGYAASDAETPLVGAPAQFDFDITPVSTGHVELVFVYQRPWEREPSRTETVAFDIVE